VGEAFAERFKMPAMLRTPLSLMAVLASGGFAFPADTPPSSPGPGYDKPLSPKPGYRLVENLSDEFHGAELNHDKWFDHMTYWKGRGSEFLPANISVGDGCLRLKASVKDEAALKELYSAIDTALTGATREIDVQSWSPVDYGDAWDPAKLAEPTLNAQLMELGMKAIGASAVMSKTRQAKQGYYEARIKTSRIAMSSSFWLQGGGSEFDITESYGHSTVDRQTKWYQDIPSKIVTSIWSCDAPAGTPAFKPMEYLAPTPLSEEFFVLGFLWGEKEVEVYYNDELVLVADLRSIPEIEHSVFASLKYLIFDKEVLLGPWLGWPTLAQLNDPEKNTFQVDWVRVWKPVLPDAGAD
jgi:hypothetical protein